MLTSAKPIENRFKMRKELLLISLLGLFLSGCKSTSTPLKVNSEADTASNSQITRVSTEAMNFDDNIQLPGNYDVDAFRRVNIASYVANFTWEEDARTTNIDSGVVASLLENELARTKRYNVFSRNCPSCDYEQAYQVENTQLDGQMEAGEGVNPDYLIEVSISLGTVIKEMYDHNQIIFRSIVTSKLVNPTTKEIIHSFAPIRHNAPAKNFFAVDGKYIGGFNLNEPNELQQAYKEVAQKAVQVLVTRVMDYYPVGGRVINYRNGQLAIDAGINRGFAVKQPVVLFLSDDGLDFPIASAIITPKQDSGSGAIIKWLDTPDATRVKAKLEALGKDYLQLEQIFAVSVGTPESWLL